MAVTSNWKVQAYTTLAPACMLAKRLTCEEKRAQGFLARHTCHMWHAGRLVLHTGSRLVHGRTKKKTKRQKEGGDQSKNTASYASFVCRVFSFGAAALDTKDPHKGPFRDLIISKHSQDVTGRSGC